MSFDLGDVVPLGLQVKDASGALVNAASVTLTITQPDGSTVAPPPVPANPSTGNYTFDFVPTQVGRHAVRWTTQTPSTGYSDAFDVQPADIGALISLARAKDALNITGTRDDEELRRALATASRMIENRCGPVLRKTVAEKITVSGYSTELLALRYTPVLSIVSVAGAPPASPVLYGPGDLDVEPESGVVRLAWGGCWPKGRHTITYTVGRAVIPDPMQTATEVLLDHLWKTQRGWATAPTMRGEPAPGSSESTYPAGFLWPNRASELLEPYVQVILS